MMGCSTPELPPGFRFHPTDEELITHYLRNQVMSMPCPVSIIPELNIYKFDPWQLPEKSGFGEGEWYFFSPRDRKYPNGARPNRATISGYWKATGTDKAIYSNDRYVGVKKALVFYKGRPPKGSKTGWIMHEYRLSSSKPRKPNGSMRLDDWVLCRIYEKQHVKNPIDEEEEGGGGGGGGCTPSQLPGLEEEDQEEKHHLGDEKGRRGGMMPSSSPLRFPRSCSLMDLLEAEYMSLSEVLNGYGSMGSSDDFHAIASNFDTDVFIGDNDDQLLNTVNFLDDNHQKQKQTEQLKFWSQAEER